MNQSTTVVIPAYNCEKTIGAAIMAVLNQTVGSIQVVVVDDGSTDATAQIIKSFPKVTYIYQDNAGPAVARNAGARAATGEFILFTDSDCQPNPDWVEQTLNGFTDDTIGVVCGSYGIANKDNALANGIHNEIIFRHQHLMPDFPKAFGSYNFGIRKKVFIEIQGFNESYRFASGEDNDLSYKVLKAGYKIYFARDSFVNHQHTENVAKYLKEQFRHGFWRVKMYLSHPNMLKGDDYTFWKDIAEVVLVGLIIILSIAAVFIPNLSILSIFVGIGLIGLEIFYSFVMNPTLELQIFYAAVMFLRSFARFFGFCAGFSLVFHRN